MRGGRQPRAGCLKRVEVGGGRVLVPTTTTTEGVTIALFADPAGDPMGLLKAM